MSDEKDEGGIIDFLAKVVFTMVLVYVVSYFSGYHEMVMGFLRNTFHPAIKVAKDTTRAVDIELKRRGIHVSNNGVQYIAPTKTETESNSKNNNAEQTNNQ